VHREEVYVRILEENRAAAMAQKEDLEGLDKLLLVDPRGSGKKG
jgi:sRNA-binding carbon storage regulator CsrA